MPDYGVHNHIEHCAGQRFAMVHSTVYLEGGFGLASILLHHLQTIPVCPEEPEHPGNHAVSRQYINSPVPIHGIIRLLEVQEYAMEYRLPHGNHILYRLSPKVGGLCSTSRPETMQVSIVVDPRVQPPVNDTSGGFSHYFH